MITLQFSSQRLPASYLIRWFTWSPYSHVDWVLPDGSLLGARGSGGVAIRPPEPFPVIAQFQIDAPDHVIDIALEQLGKPYDWSAIAGIVTRRNWQKPDSWFCSELVAWAFEQAGRPLIRCNHHHRVTPRDLLLSTHLKPI